MGVYIKKLQAKKVEAIFAMLGLHIEDGDIIEVTEPHGRLIEVTNKLRQELCWYEAYTGIDEAPVKYANSVIDDAPTVIEAEGE